jgi:hypothetical protein
MQNIKKDIYAYLNENYIQNCMPCILYVVKWKLMNVKLYAVRQLKPGHCYIR